MTEPKHPLNAAELSNDTLSPEKPNMLLEYGPIFLFVVLYFILRKTGDPQTAIFPAAGVFAVAAVIAMVWAKVKNGTIPKILLLTTAIIVVSVGLAFLTGDKKFIYMKPTVVNILFGGAAIIGALIGKNPLKMLMGSAYEMSEIAWKSFAIRWGIFFFAMAAVNEYVWRNFEEPFWVNFKAFGFMGLTFVFLISQMPFLMKHAKIDKGDAP